MITRKGLISLCGFSLSLICLSGLSYFQMEKNEESGLVSACEAHSGRTDSAGCHTCYTNCEKYGLSYGQYHCHNGSSSSSASTGGGTYSGSGSFNATTQAQLDEQQRMYEEQQRQEQARLEEERKKAEEARLAEEKRIKEQQEYDLGKSEGYAYKQANPNQTFSPVESSIASQSDKYKEGYKAGFDQAQQEIQNKLEHDEGYEAAHQAKIKDPSLAYTEPENKTEVYKTGYKNGFDQAVLDLKTTQEGYDQGYALKKKEPDLEWQNQDFESAYYKEGYISGFDQAEEELMTYTQTLAEENGKKDGYRLEKINETYPKGVIKKEYKPSYEKAFQESEQSYFSQAKNKALSDAKEIVFDQKKNDPENPYDSEKVNRIYSEEYKNQKKKCTEELAELKSELPSQAYQDGLEGKENLASISSYKSYKIYSDLKSIYTTNYEKGKEKALHDTIASTSLVGVVGTGGILTTLALKKKSKTNRKAGNQ